MHAKRKFMGVGVPFSMNSTKKRYFQAKPNSFVSGALTNKIKKIKTNQDMIQKF
jgi:hypothetical protein